MREFLEKNYTDEAIETDDLTIKLVIKALLEVRLFHISSVALHCVQIHFLDVNMGKYLWKFCKGGVRAVYWGLWVLE